MRRKHLFVAVFIALSHTVPGKIDIDVEGGLTNDPNNINHASDNLRTVACISGGEEYPTASAPQVEKQPLTAMEALFVIISE